jgi:hypothetical protein
MMNKKHEWKIHDKVPTSVAVVKNSNKSSLSRYDVNNLPTWLNQKYFVPSPKDMIDRSPLQRVYVLTPTKLTELMNHEKVHITIADALIQSVCEDTLTTLCVDNSTISDSTNSKSIISHIFIGADAPDTSSMKCYNIPDVGVTAFYGPMKYSEIKNKHPLSISLVDALFHPRTISFLGHVRMCSFIRSQCLTRHLFVFSF